MDVELRIKTEFGSDYLGILFTPYIPRVGEFIEVNSDMYKVTNVIVGTRYKGLDTYETSMIVLVMDRV